MIHIMPAPRRTARLRCCLIALLLALSTLLGGCFTPGDYDPIVTLPEGELDDPPVVTRQKGSAATKTGTGLELVVDWIREETDLGESFRLTAYLVANEIVVCSPKSTGTLVINDEIYYYAPDNTVVDSNDPVMWRLVVTTKAIYIDDNQPVHVLITWPFNDTFNEKYIRDLTVEFDA